MGLYSVPSSPTKSLQPRGGSYSWLGQPSTGPPPGLCLKPDLRGRTGVWTKERLQSWLEALDPHPSGPRGCVSVSRNARCIRIWDLSSTKDVVPGEKGCRNGPICHFRVRQGQGGSFPARTLLMGPIGHFFRVTGQFPPTASVPSLCRSSDPLPRPQLLQMPTPLPSPLLPTWPAPGSHKANHRPSQVSGFPPHSENPALLT